MEFQPEETEKNITIHILDDSRVEGDELFELYLTGGVGVHLWPFFRAEVTIPENDGNLNFNLLFLSNNVLHTIAHNNYIDYC